MDLPFDSPIIEFIYWFINTGGVGGITVMMLGAGLVLSFGSVLLWISNGNKSPDNETFTYPTPTLFHHEENN